MLLKNSVTAAAREATLPSSPEQIVTDPATNYTDQMSSETATVSISPSLSSVEAGDNRHVNHPSKRYSSTRIDLDRRRLLSW